MNTFKNKLQPMRVSSGFGRYPIKRFVHNAMMGSVGTSKYKSAEAIVDYSKWMKICVEGILIYNVSVV